MLTNVTQWVVIEPPIVVAAKHYLQKATDHRDQHQYTRSSFSCTGMSAPTLQILSPPASLLAIPPPRKPYTPPDPPTVFALLRNLFVFLIHVLLRPFSATLIPAAPNHPYALDLSPAPPPVSTTAVVPHGKRERRSRSKSPSSSPSSSMTMTEGTLDGGASDGVRRRWVPVKSGFEVDRIRIRARSSGVSSKLEGWAKEAFEIS